MTFYSDPGHFSNEDLVIGTPEYRRQRYPVHPEGGKPEWKIELEWQLQKKTDKPYSRRHDGMINSLVGNALNSDIRRCIERSLHFKTKSFEYIPKTGHINLYGKYAARLNRTLGLIDSFTLKNINTKESRYRLRFFGIDLVIRNGKTFWKMYFGKKYYEHLLNSFNSIGGLRDSFKKIFPSILVGELNPEDMSREHCLLCELTTEVDYPVWSGDTCTAFTPSILAETSFYSSTFKSTDIFLPEHDRSASLHQEQLVLELDLE